MEARSRACPGETKKTVTTLAGHVLSMTSTAKFFQFWYLGTLYDGRCAQAAKIPPVAVASAAARAAPRRVNQLALLSGCSRVCIKRNNQIYLAVSVSLNRKWYRTSPNFLCPEQAASTISNVFLKHVCLQLKNPNVLHRDTPGTMEARGLKDGWSSVGVQASGDFL
jgi:hypothetical protein